GVAQLFRNSSILLTDPNFRIDTLPARTRMRLRTPVNLQPPPECSPRCETQHAIQGPQNTETRGGYANISCDASLACTPPPLSSSRTAKGQAIHIGVRNKGTLTPAQVEVAHPLSRPPVLTTRRRQNKHVHTTRSDAKERASTAARDARSIGINRSTQIYGEQFPTRTGGTVVSTNNDSSSTRLSSTAAKGASSSSHRCQ
ncbi:unnamed protein product, partial [Ectocarpus fasciculatus]